MKMKSSRRTFIRKVGIGAAFVSTGITSFGHAFETAKNKSGKQVLNVLDNKFRKIDIHTHISSDALYLREIMDQWNLKMFTICNEGLKSDRLYAQRKAAREISKKFPQYFAWCTTFDLNGINDPGWSDRVIEKLKDDFDQGALAVKVWKEIGMQLKDSESNFIQIDNPLFDPIFKFISRNNKTLFMHIGDPPDYWLSADSSGLPDAWYKEGNGVWNRIGKFRGEVSYDKLMRARDQILYRYPNLKIVGCHMGNLSYNLDQIAKRLDHLPNYAVETSFTLSYLMGQAREKVRKFFLKYQDRILYGSDVSGGLVASPFLVDMSKINERWSGEEIKKLKLELLEQYDREYNYFATDQEFSMGEYTVRGLKLPEEILHKLYYKNSVSWIPGLQNG
jgi:hypothetical protein